MEAALNENVLRVGALEIARLRQKLAEAIPGCPYIHTHFGFGYRLSPE
jgi:DNA-binding response OmpR family regulator